MSRTIFYISLNDLSAAPYPEVALPALVRNGWNITIIAPNATRSAYRKHLPFACRSSDIPDYSWTRKELHLQFEMLKARMGRYDVIYINSQMMGPRAAIALAGPKLGGKYVFHAPDYFCPIEYPIRHYLDGRFSRKCQLYINNEFHRGYLSYIHYRMKNTAITAPPNLPASWPIPQKSGGKRAEIDGGDPNAFVLSLHGGPSRLRHTTELCASLKYLPKRFRIVMTGRTHAHDDFDKMLSEMGVADRVTRLPRLDFNDMLGYSINANAGVLLYRNSDLGNFFTAPGRITEYLACGLPVLGSNHTGLENLILKYQLGTTAFAQDPLDIARSITQLAKNVESGLHSAEHQRDVFLNYLAFDHWESTVVDAFEQLASNTLVPQRPTFPWIPLK